MDAKEHAIVWEAAGDALMVRFEEVKFDVHMHRPMLSAVALCRVVSAAYGAFADDPEKMQRFYKKK